MARVREFKVLEGLTKSEVETQLPQLTSEGWEVIGFDAADGGSNYWLLLVR